MSHRIEDTATHAIQAYNRRAQPAASITKTTLTCLHRLAMTIIIIETTASLAKMTRINIGMSRESLNQEIQKSV